MAKKKGAKGGKAKGAKGKGKKKKDGNSVPEFDCSSKNVNGLIYVRGAGLKSERVVCVSGQRIAADPRECTNLPDEDASPCQTDGLQLIVLDSKTMNYYDMEAARSGKPSHYDTSTSREAAERLADDIEYFRSKAEQVTGVGDAPLVLVITSYGQWDGSFTQHLADEIRAIGGRDLSKYLGNSKPYAIVSILDGQTPPSTKKEALSRTDMTVGAEVEMIVGQHVSVVWEQKPIMGFPPAPRLRASSTKVDGLMYMFGGYAGDRFFNDIQIFDPEALEWTQPTISGDIPSARAGHKITLIRKQIFMFGGSTNGVMNNDLCSLDTETNQWVTVNPHGNIPEPREGHTFAACDSKIYLFAGKCSGPTNDLYVLDTTLLEWSKPPVSGTLPDARMNHAAVFIGTNMWVFGGRKNPARNDIFYLDTVSMTWVKPRVHGQPPPCREGHAMFAIDHRLVICGGYDGKKKFSDCYAFDTQLNIWLPQPADDLVTAGEGMVGECIEGRVVVFGGCDGPNRPTNEVQVGDLRASYGEIVIPPDPRSPEEDALHQRVKAAFDLFDRQKKGVCDVREVGTIVRSLGINPTEAKLRELINEIVDDEPTGFVQFEKFESMMVPVLKQVQQGNPAQEFVRHSEGVILQAFRLFDPEETGFIDAEQLKDLLMSKGEQFFQEEVDEMMRDAMDHVTGKVAYEDFAEKLSS
eukprot:Rmarinus@m.16562